MTSVWPAVLAYGSADDMERLIDDTQRDRRRSKGCIEVYLRNKRY